MAEHEDDGPEAEADADSAEKAAGEAVYDVPVELSAVLGTARVPVSRLLKMGRGAVLELDRVVGDPADIYVNKQMVARGEVVVIDDRLAVTLTDAVKTPQH
jgi:flagellar motor switch protein FliN/FliY